VSGTLIIGGGQAALSAAAELRKHRYDRPITMLTDEAVAPYQRPPLSKAYLSGELSRDRLWLKPAAWYQNAGINLRTAVHITALDRGACDVIAHTGERIGYDTLILAMGGQARRLPVPGANLDRVHVLRTLAETEALSAAFHEARSIIIIGAGYIGLEVAASARKRGMAVTVLEAAARPMARTASALVGGWFGAIHRGYGVDLRVNTPVKAIVGDEKVTGVELDDGEMIEADLVLVAAGLSVNDGLAATAGLACEDGIVVDHQACTEDSNIYAIGDVARFHSRLYDRSLRLESVQNAVDQAKVAARAICGQAVDYDPVPWFWSDQYEMKLQITGLIEGADERVRRGDPEGGRFALFHLRDGVMIACEAINSVPEYRAAQHMIATGARPAPDRLRNPGVAMKTFLP